ncbi:SEC14 cytosolic factor [Coprinopsis cinerea AmutBmut pab1-1]|nr:SEC14 cytosolic factor [Coprinopsis cinerea AmutBmut pab1-1]KAG2010181.1 SEC14 cytosolic factor [Coprinopsis cinerea AmutBmut pab1-1]
MNHFLIYSLFVLSFFQAFSAGSVIPFRRIRIPDSELNRRKLDILDLPERISIPFEPTGFVITLRPRPTSTPSQIPPTAETFSPVTRSASTSPSSADSTVEPSQTSPASPTPTNASGKFVVAHHMVGNTFPYTKDDWLEDIQLAHASGIDGFALNTGREVWEPERIADAYQAALELGHNFKLFLSLDMASLPCNSHEDAAYLRRLVSQHASHPNQLMYNDKAFVSTFAGESCQFGHDNVVEGWKHQFTLHPELKERIYFVPSFFMDPARFGEFKDVMDGTFNWNSGWPIQVTTSFAREQLDKLAEAAPSESSRVGRLPLLANPLQRAVSDLIGTVDSDNEHLEALNALTPDLNRRDDGGNLDRPAYMAAVSPWFFTHYGQDSFNKNFVFLADQHLYAKRWESLVESRDKFDIVQILTWNDFGESHYIGPIKGAQPNSEAWTDGMPHTAWLDLTSYYARAFKTGEYPKIEKDKIFMWSRPHSTEAESPDPVPKPDNFELMEDAIWAVVMTTKPSTVVLSTSPTSRTFFQVPAGVSKLSVPITPGGTMRGTIERDGAVIVDLHPSSEEFTFQGSPQSYNFNVFVASATAS